MKLSFRQTSISKFKLHITGSKSISNRYLILKAQFPNIELSGLSDCDDTRVLHKALTSLKENGDEIDIHHAGTAMRFLTAYLSSLPNLEVVLKGSKRMHERPIGILVEAMRELGGDIKYLGNDGFPPLKIRGESLHKDKISIPASVSSQYITALMLIAPSFKNGLSIYLQSKVTSKPYLMMTAVALKSIGVEVDLQESHIQVHPKTKIEPKTIAVESDWSSASYFYSCLALMDHGEFELSTFQKNSLQGDSKVVEFYKLFGIETRFNGDSILISKKGGVLLPEKIELDLNDTPDLAQTIAVTCLGLNIACNLTGLHTLKVKETDRLVALKTEIEKFGAEVEISNESLQLSPKANLKESVTVHTYQDHRMAMAFAPLAIKVDLTILNPEVVSKSFPDFWGKIKALGIQ
jgi:3-phosphoshikimate 1-carboxyvinyltransferase